MYKDVQLLIDGQWVTSTTGRTIDVTNPATGDTIGTIPHAGQEDMDLALAAANKGFAIWRDTSAHERTKIMRRAAVLLRERASEIAGLLTQEQGKPLPEAKGEVLAAADVIDWFAEEARRTYGRLIPARTAGVTQMAIKEPVGPVAAFTPWNFPVNQVVRKLSAALAAGCSIIVKAPEETPASPAELIRAFVDAGVPAGVIGLLYGNPAEISSYLIPHPVIRKVSFTGSTVVGKQLAAMAGQHMKRVTMELGGHAPAIVFNDADIDAAVKGLMGAKFRNAGQVCIAPTRFLVQRGVFDTFVEKMVAAASKLRVGNGAEAGTEMGPMANERRITAMEELVADAVQQGAKLLTGGKRIDRDGYFFEPTVLANVPLSARAMQEEPFGPFVMINAFDTIEEVITEANRLPYGLASYAFTASQRNAQLLSDKLETGMLTINHIGLALPETPFGGTKDSGYGSEGGAEAMEAYLATKFVTRLDI